MVHNEIGTRNPYMENFILKYGLIGARRAHTIALTSEAVMQMYCSRGRVEVERKVKELKGI